MTEISLNGQSLIPGQAEGRLLASDTGLSFWGGVDPDTGLVIDHHHPLSNENVTGAVLLLPSGRGSSSGSGVLLQLLMNDIAPAALVFMGREEILTLGVLVAQVLFQKSIPVLCIEGCELGKISDYVFAAVQDNQILMSQQPVKSARLASEPGAESSVMSKGSHGQLKLEQKDRALLSGESGKGAQLAMEVVTRMATIQGAESLIDVKQGHIDACVYHGASSLLFAQRLRDLGAKVAVPTTLNSLSVDKRRWQTQGIDSGFGEPAAELGTVYEELGAQPTFTCAPYLLDSAPVCGDQIVWAESNAIMYANSVIGARTLKYPDFLDACIAITGRAPGTGSHLDEGRLPTLRIDAGLLVHSDAMKARNMFRDDLFWPLLGHHIGELAGGELPLIVGLENSQPTLDDLKAFSAAFATTSSTPMFHMAEITPEAGIALEHLQSLGQKVPEASVTTAALSECWRALNSASDQAVDMICLGNPHFSLTECTALAELCQGKSRHASVKFVVTLGRAIHQAAMENGTVALLEEFGIELVNDTCWCMLLEPVIPVEARNLMTNSGKYAHYGPGLTGRRMHFNSLAACVDSACTGLHLANTPSWLQKTDS